MLEQYGYSLEAVVFGIRKIKNWLAQVQPGYVTREFRLLFLQMAALLLWADPLIISIQVLLGYSPETMVFGHSKALRLSVQVRLEALFKDNQLLFLQTGIPLLLVVIRIMEAKVQLGFSPAATMSGHSKTLSLLAQVLLDLPMKGVRLPFLQTVIDRKSTRLNSSHLGISYAVFCLKKK